jgi:hypothetical protein
MRRDKLIINKAYGLRQIKEDLRQTLKEHHTLATKELVRAAAYIQGEAEALVPVKTGQLRDSIDVTVSRSPRYPGIIATATAINYRTGYDYALIQEVNESYEHPNGGQAHYLEQPFIVAVEDFYERMGW